MSKQVFGFKAGEKRIRHAREVYDLAAEKGWKEIATLNLGERCILGQWVSLGEIDQNDMILTTRSKGLKILAEGLTWEEVAIRAGLLGSVGEVKR